MKHDSRLTARSDLRDLEGRFTGLIATAMRAAIAQTVDPVRRSACLPRAPIRRRSASLLVALLVGIAWAAKLASSNAFAGPLDQDGAESLLPPRALLRIGTDLLRADTGIAAIAFSPDGRIAAAEGSGPSPRVVLFDVRSGRRTKVLTARGEPMEWVECLAFSPDGTKLLWGEYGGKVVLWDLTGDRLLFRDNLHDRAVSDVRFSPDGKLMASAGGDAIRLRRVTTPDEAVPGLRDADRTAAGACLCALRNGTPVRQDGRALRAWHSRPMGRGSSPAPSRMPQFSSGTPRTAGSCGRSPGARKLHDGARTTPA